jgi:tetrahydromethanopterin S-methyltransferase subunit G
MNALPSEITMNDESNKIRLVVLENTIVKVDESLKRIEKRFDKVDSRLDFIEVKFDKKFEQIDGRFDQFSNEILYIHKESQVQFRWIMGAVLGLYGILITLMSRGLLLSN